MAQVDKSVSLSYLEQTLVLEALSVYRASVIRAAKAAKNPDVRACHEKSVLTIDRVTGKVAA